MSRFARTEALEKGVSVGKTVKVLGWYDNEREFFSRTVEMVKYIGKRL